jgi:uncharacterized membrane protein (UPF0136 family)
MGFKTGIRNSFGFLILLAGLIVSIFGVIGIQKESSKTTFIIALAVGLVLFVSGVLLSNYKNPGTKKIVLGFYAGVLIATTAVGFFVPTEAEKNQKEIEQADAWKTKDNSIMADIHMREFVKQQLKSPSTAKFAPATEGAGRIIEKKEDYIYFVKSFVDSQNSFGATIRTHYHGEIKQTSDDTWQLLSLEFED